LSSLKYFYDNQPSTTGASESNSRLQSGAEDSVMSDGLEEGEESVVAQHSPLYWRSDVGQKAIKSLPLVAPPLDLRQLNWTENNEDEQEDFSPDEDAVSNDRLVSTAHPAVGSALSVARRNASKRAATAPE